MVKYDQYHTKEELLSSHFQDRLGYSAAIPTVVPVATDNTKRREARAGLATQIIFLRAQALEEKRALGERSNEEIAQLYEDIQSDSILPEKKLIDSKHFIIPTNNSGSYYSNPKTIDHQFQPIPIIPRDPLECRELPSHFQQRAYPPTATGEARSAGIRLLFTSPAFNIAVVLLEILIHIFCAILSKSKNQVNFVSTATLLLWSTMDVLAFIRMTVAMMDDMVARFIVALHLGIGGVDPAKYLRELKPKNKNSFIYFLAGKASTFFGTNSLTNMRDLLGYYVGTAIDWSERYGHHMVSHLSLPNSFKLESIDSKFQKLKLTFI